MYSKMVKPNGSMDQENLASVKLSRLINFESWKGNISVSRAMPSPLNANSQIKEECKSHWCQLWDNLVTTCAFTNNIIPCFATRVRINYRMIIRPPSQ